MMSHWNLNDKDFHDWAVKEVAKLVMFEQLEDFCEKAPPEELKQINKVLENQIIPILWSEAIPISKVDLFAMFRSWFVRNLSTNQTATTKKNNHESNSIKKSAETLNTTAVIE